MGYATLNIHSTKRVAYAGMWDRYTLGRVCFGHVDKYACIHVVCVCVSRDKLQDHKYTLEDM